MKNLRSFSAKAQRVISKYYTDSDEVEGYVAVYVAGEGSMRGPIMMEVHTDNRCTKSDFEAYIKNHNKVYGAKLLKIFNTGFHNEILDKEEFKEHTEKIHQKYNNIESRKEEIPGDRV